MSEQPAEAPTGDSADSAAAGAAVCAFPGCTRPPIPYEGVGQPSKYCADAKHTPLTAYREKKRRQRAGGAEEAPDRPVKAAVESAGVYRTDVLAAVRQLLDSLPAVVERLETMADPEAAAAEIQTEKESAAASVAELRKTLALEHRQRVAAVADAEAARVEKKQAEDAADEADTELQEARTQFEADAARLEEEKAAAIVAAQAAAEERVRQHQAAADLQVSKAKEAAAAEVAGAKAELETFKAELQTFKTTTAEEREAERREHQKELDEAAGKVTRAEADKATAEGERDQAQAHAREVEQTTAVLVAKAEATVTAKEETISGLKESAKTAREDHQNTVKDLEATTKELRARVEELLGEKHQVEQKAATDAQAAAARVSELERQLATHTDKGKAGS